MTMIQMTESYAYFEQEKAVLLRVDSWSGATVYKDCLVDGFFWPIAGNA